MANVVADRTATPPGLIGYCPSAVCSAGPSSLKGCSSKCTSSDGSGDWKIALFATPHTLRKVLKDLYYNSTVAEYDNELAITIEDFDDGEGPMMDGSSPGNLQAEIRIGISTVRPPSPPPPSPPLPPLLPPSPTDDDALLGLVIGASLGGTALLLLGGCGLWYWLLRQSRDYEPA